MHGGTPDLAIVIPCHNEQRYIARCLVSILESDYPRKSLEILIVDGMSSDGTREIIGGFTQKHPFIRMIDNPAISKPAALNLGIAETNADIIMRIDAHSTYASNYVSQLVAGLVENDFDNIGGIRETDPGTTGWARAVSLAVSHPFAAGNAIYRTGVKDSSIRLVDTVFCGCYRRSVFDKIGGFNPKLLRAQDREFNARLSAQGGTIALDPNVRCTYYPRTAWMDYARWSFQGAYWLFYARRFTDTKMYSARNFAPGLFVLWHAIATIGLIVAPKLSLALIAPIVGYWLLNLYFASQAAYKERMPQLLPALSLLFATTHYAYGLGSWYGLLAGIWKGKSLPQRSAFHPVIQSRIA